MTLLLSLASTNLPVPIPHDLTLPLPLPKMVLAVMLVGTFLLHIFFVNLMVGGSMLALFYEWMGWRGRKAHWDRLAYAICQTITVNKSLAVVLGVGPLLVMNLLYTVWFYSANALTGVAWIMVVPSVTMAFLLTYAQKFLWSRMQSRKRLHLALGASASLLFGFIPFIFLSNINLMLFPERWSEVTGFLSAVLLPNVIQRYVHFMLASLAVTSLYLVWRVRRGTLLEDEDSNHPQLKRAPLLRRFYWLAFMATLLQFAAGPWVLFTLPRHGLDGSTLLFILSGVALGLYLLSVLFREYRAPDHTIGQLFPLAAILMTAIVVFMGTGRHRYREAALSWHRELVLAKTEEFKELSKQARIQAEADAAAQSSGDPIRFGESVYKSSCVACHQPTGLGIPGSFPPLAGSEWVNDQDPSRLIRIVLHGMDGPVRVKGVQYPGAAMPPHKDLFSDIKLAAVLTYVRQAWGNAATEVSPEAVESMRKLHSGRTKPWTELELGRPESLMQ